MDNGAWSKGGVAVIAAIIGLLGTPAAAIAGLAVVTDHATVAQNQKGSATAKCARGSEAVAGGFASPAFDSRFMAQSIIHYASARTSDREWRTVAHNFGDASGGLDAYAVCDSRSPNLLVRSKTKTVTPGGTKRADPAGVGTVVARCPKGSEAISGGFSSPNAADKGKGATYAFTSKRVGKRGWKVRAANNDFDNPREASAVAYCDKSEPGLDVQSDQVTIKPGSKSTLDLGCRHGDKPLSGGFASTYRAATGPTDSPDAAFAFTSRPISGDRWRVSAFAIGPRVVKAKAASLARRAAGPTLTAYAYCK